MAAEDSQRPCVCLRVCRGDMPFLPQVAPDRDAVRKIHAEHPRRRPAVEEPGVGRVCAVRKPDRCEMGATVIGGVPVLPEYKR